MNHQPPTPPDSGKRPDLLLQRYAEANAFDEARPDPALREAVLAHARALAAAHAQPGPSNAAPARRDDRQRTAANDSAWKLRALGSVAVLGLVGLLVLQFDRGTPQDRELALGRTSPSTTPVDVTPSPAPAPAPVPTPPLTEAAHAEPPAPVPDQPAQASQRAPATAPAARSPAPGAPERQRAASEASAVREMPRPSAPRTLADEAGDSASRSVAPPPPSPAALPVTPTAPEPPRSEAAEASSNATHAQGAAAPQAELFSRSAPAAATARSQAAPSARKESQDSEGPAEPTGAATTAPLSDPDGALLAAAARRDALQAAREALAQGARVDASLPDGRTALMLAAQRGDADLIRLLLEAGADVHRVDREGRSAAAWARRAGQTAVLPLLQPAR